MGLLPPRSGRSSSTGGYIQASKMPGGGNFRAAGRSRWGMVSMGRAPKRVPPMARNHGPMKKS